MTAAPPPAPPSPDPPPAAPPPPPPGPPARPPLRRSRTDKVLGGVCGGLAEYSGIDALLWRVGFVALTLAGGSGVVVYALLWLLVPGAPGGPPLGRTDDERPDRGPRSPVPGLTLAGLLIVVGLLVLVGRATDLDPGPHGVLAAALLVVGLGLVAAAFTGGRRAKGGLVALGAALSLAVVATAAAPWTHWEGAGDRVHAPSAPDAVRPLHGVSVGDVPVDLSGLDVGDLDAPVATRLHAGVGDLDVVVPRSADLRVEVASAPGDVVVLGDERSDGGWFPGSGSAPWTDDGNPEIVLTVDAGVGDVEVSRA